MSHKNENIMKNELTVEEKEKYLGDAAHEVGDKKGFAVNSA